MNVYSILAEKQKYKLQSHLDNIAKFPKVLNSTKFKLAHYLRLALLGILSKALDVRYLDISL